jgi:ankyrin repeat protein
MMPLITAAVHARVEVIKLLLSLGADVNALVDHEYLVEYQDSSALTAACRRGHLACVKALVESGADVNQRCNSDDDDSPLCRAARHGHLMIVRYLLKAGARLTSRAFGWAVQNAHVLMYKLMFSAGGSEFLKADKHSRFARLAIGNRGIRRGDLLTRQMTILKHLIDAGAEISQPSDPEVNEMGFTPLTWALAERSPELANLLIEAGADVHSKDNVRGYSALHRAAEYGYLDVVERLLKRGADSSVRNFEGHTALELAKKEGHKAIIKLLEAK